LEDDGIPRLDEQLKALRMKMEDKPFLKLVKTERENRKNSNTSKDFDSQGGGSVH
jgi:hypothetical protein